MAPSPAASRVYPPHRFMEQGMGWSTIGVDAQADSPSPSTSLQSSADSYHSGGFNEHLTDGYRGIYLSNVTLRECKPVTLHAGQFYNQDRGFAPMTSSARTHQTNPFGLHLSTHHDSVMASPFAATPYDGSSALKNRIYPLQGLAGSAKLLPPIFSRQGALYGHSPSSTKSAGMKWLFAKSLKQPTNNLCRR